MAWLVLAISALLSGLEGRPNYLVYRPVADADAYNDHFQVIWDDGRKLYYAFWTQATREGAPDMRVVFSKSADRGRTWTAPKPLRDRSGRAFLHPNSPCPMYDLGGCAAGSGTCFALVHDAYDDSIPPLGLQKRGPLYFLRGTFDPKGDQPVLFEKEGVFLPLETDNSCYSSYTVADGERVLWFGLRKHELVGKRVK